MPPADAPATLRFDDDLTRRKHADALAALIEGEVRFEKHDRMLYATDASIYQVEPIGVVIPKHFEDVKRIVEYCRDHRLPILPRGGGTSLAGQCTNHAVVVDFSVHLTDLEWVADDTGACGVQPGITIDDLNDQLKEHGIFFAPDPATARQCNIGGAIGNNAAGTRSIMYGRTSESLEAVTALLASGEECTLAEGAGSDVLWRDSRIPDAVRAKLSSQTAIARRLAEGIIQICARYEPFIRERFPKTIRRNAGYALDMMLEDIDEAKRRGVSPLETLNLADLICGSEGTLAVVTFATLKLQPLPKAKGLAVIGFDSLEAAIDCVVPMLKLNPSAVELLDDTLIDLARNNLECGAYVDLMPQPRSGRLEAVLYMEFFSHRGPEEVRAQFSNLKSQISESTPTAGFAAYTDAESMANALKLRKAGEPLLHGIPGDRKPLGFVEDNAVPVERLAEFVRGFKRIIAAHGTRAAFWAHASVGVLHVRPLLDMRNADDRVHMEQMAVEVADLAKSLGGVMSGEHGDGRVRGPLLERYFGPELMQAFREVKQLFDPQNLLNPGNIVAPEPIESIHEHTRVRPTGFDLRTQPIETFFDYTQEHGLDHAVELCNGSGVCRKKQGGTMCPSYMATLDERHSTRGRGNALRLAITGQLTPPPPGRGSGVSRGGGTPHAPAAPLFNDPETLETLSLCLSCKACKSECPSNVDIAKYKAEYLAQSYKAAGRTPLKAYAFGRVRALNRIGSAFAPLSNWIANSALNRAIINPILGLAPKRTLPRWERSLFSQARREYSESYWESVGFTTLMIGARAETSPVVILYPDCFTTYNEPSIGLATVRLLRSFGYRVAIPKLECCGRAQISTGLLDEAAFSSASAASVLGLLAGSYAAAETLAGIVVCEPSCLSTVKDEWKTLRRQEAGGVTLPRREWLELAAAKSFLPEDFLDKQWDTHPRRPAFRTPSGNVALHGHCHQKALWGTETTARFLRRIAGDRLRVLDTGCCGMAGSFGYTADRYDLSMKIGELALFPLVRSLGPDDVIVAPGTSCRHQIHDGTKRDSVHPMVFASEMLDDEQRARLTQRENEWGSRIRSTPALP
jgi:FAD/FMN-containing dehydrogenase/Fe-S oxidoreductase